jgi:signal transduction histidine kinase
MRSHAPVRSGSTRDALLIFLGWTAFAVALSAGYLVQGADVVQVPIGVRLAHFLPYYWIWAILTPPVLEACRLIQLRVGRRPIGWLLHAGVGVIVATVQLAAYVPISLMVGSAWGTAPFLEHLTGALVRHLPGNLLTYAVLVAAWLAVDYRQRMREALVQARLDALRIQLQPHFLFNSLEAAAATMHRDVEAAEEMLERLAGFLRLVLRRDDRPLVPLAEELELLEHYLAVMRLRFGPRLVVTTTVDPGLDRALVPPLVLQPLVENALHHGIGRRAGPGRVEITIERRDRMLAIRVEDDGAGLADRPGQSAPERIGLSNTRSRLEQLFGSAFAVRLLPGAAGGARAELEFPLTGAASLTSAPDRPQPYPRSPRTVAE